jgi:hypothetical protein
MTFPSDADGDALRRLAEAGNDMSRPMTIEFYVAVPDQRAGFAVAESAAAAGYRTSVEEDEEDREWTCYCSREMIPTYGAVIAAQQELGRLSSPQGGYSDGWGSFGNVEVEPNVGRQGVGGLAGKYRDDPTLRAICEEAYERRDSERPE